MTQDYIFNEKAGVFNCNICGDVKIVMTGDGEQPPDGCCSPFCESNTGKKPAPGLKVIYSEYPVPCDENCPMLSLAGEKGIIYQCLNYKKPLDYIKVEYSRVRIKFFALKLPECKKNP